MKKLLLVLCLAFNMVTTQTAFAQEGGDDTFADESIKDISTVAGLGAGGAILGLSTLSFVEEPGDHLKNIVVGGAIGIILGVAVVAYSQANKSKDLYETNAYLDNSEFGTSERKNWLSTKNEVKPIKATSLNYTFSF